MTIHHLLTHTSGLPSLPSGNLALLRSLQTDRSFTEEERVKMEELFNEAPIDSIAELLTYVGESSFDLLGAPGMRFNYSNEGYSFLGAIIERVSGRSYESYVTENILQPIGMTNSTFLAGDFPGQLQMATLYTTKRSADKKAVVAAPENHEEQRHDTEFHQRKSGVLWRRFTDVRLIVERSWSLCTV